MQTGQWFSSTTGTPWWFDSGALCLDFGYTGDNSGYELLDTPEALQFWLQPRFEQLEAHPGEQDLVDAKLLRGAIMRLARALAGGEESDAGDVNLLNLYAATPDVPPRMPGGSLQAGGSLVRTGQVLSTIARDAIAHFAPERSERIRKCAGEHCELIFFDDTRAGTRRWCSMQRCGNRAKARAHRRRQRERSGT